MVCLGDNAALPARSSGLRSGSDGKESQAKSSDKWREENIRWDFLVPILPDKVCFAARVKKQRGITVRYESTLANPATQTRNESRHRSVMTSK